MTGFHLKQLRLQTNTSKAALSIALGVTWESIRYWEQSPAKEIPNPNAEKLRDYFYGNPAGSKWGYA